MTNTTAVRRRPRWPWVVLVIVLVLGALVAVGELVARAVVPNTIRSLVISHLDLPAEQQLDVQVPGGDTEFPTQADAEAWLTESWRDIADAGATQVTLRNGVDVVYGPMPLAEG